MFVVIVRLLLQLGQNPRRVFIRPVGEHHHVVAFVAVGLGLQRIDDQRAVHAQLFLEAGMAVVPVRTMLFYLEAVFVQAIRSDTGEAEAWHAVHVGRQQDAVPVNRGVYRQAVTHTQGHGVAFAPAQQRARDRAVDGHGGALFTGKVDVQCVDGQIELGTGQYGLLARTGQRPDWLAPQAEAGERAAGSQAFDHGAP